MSSNQQRPRVFISHSHHDKPFVRKLVEDLRGANLHVWLDEQDLAVGDSIIARVSDGLKDSDYLVAVLSRSSMQSKWVQAELNAALSGQLSGKGTAVLPVLIEDVDLPPLLADRLYADFRVNYKHGLDALITAFRQEDMVPLLKTAPTPLAPSDSPCITTLDSLTKADLRRRIKKKMNRTEVSVVWYDTLFSDMDNDLPGTNIDKCIIELIERTVNRGLTFNLLDAICHTRPDVANP
ncbi:MAG: toll/interleukin-1 receptor domain-containing protein [Candidatus Competibacter sp.]|nr:toll/interleukin-1 receptor domain-containing protein [Candidatus Competibacter sp.]